MAKKMLVFCGSDAPEKAFPPFMLSSGALSAEMEVTLFFTMSGLNIVRKGGAEEIKLEGAPRTPTPSFDSSPKPPMKGHAVTLSSAPLMLTVAQEFASPSSF